MSNIRVTYSGLIGFSISIISVFTGIMFTVIITRNLTPDEFGLWAIIGSMISYFLIMEPIISYWTTREIARGKNIGTTSIIMSLIFSVCSIPLYIASSFFISEINQTSFDIMFFAAILIPCFFISQTLIGINQGHKPHATSYGTLIFESLKIPVGLGLVFYLQLGIEGAILTTLIAYVVKLFIQFYFARTKLKLRLDITLIKNWLKLSPLTVYSTLPHFIWTLDVVLFSIITASSVGVAYYTISLAIASVIGHSSMISQGLYPKLLSGGSHDHISENLSHMLYFSIPLLGIVIIFAKPALFLLNPVYSGLSLVVIFLGIRTFFYVFNSIFYKILLGLENVDKKNEIEFGIYLKSKLFFVPTIQIIHYSCYIVFLVTVIFFLNQNNYKIEDMIVVWSIISVALSIPFSIYAGILTYKLVKFKIPYRKIVVYGFMTLIFSVIFTLTSELILVYDQRFFIMMPTVILMLSICGSIYLAGTYFLDRNIRFFWNSIFRELRKL